MQLWNWNRQALLACLSAAIILLPCFSSLQRKPILDKIKFDPQSEAFKSWQKPEDPTIFSFYFFNWTNPEDIYNPAIKPKFDEVGPYVYKAFIEKTDITWNNENETITYKNLVNYEFDKGSSSGDPSDVITTIDMVALAASNSAKDGSYLLKVTVRLLLMSTGSKIFIQKTIKELLFEGYQDPILALRNTVPFVENRTNDRFGWLNGRNGTAGNDGIFNIATSSDNLGELQMWNYQNKTPFYHDHCSEIKGSTGQLYPRDIERLQIEIYSTQACRTIELEFEKNMYSVQEISGFKYTLGSKVFDNGTLVEENKCFCKEECPASGVIDVSECREGAPIYLSMPHFYLADLSYGNAVEGLSPEKDEHESYIILQQTNNTVLDARSRIQYNVLLQPVEDLPLYENISEIMFPVFWYEKKVTTSNNLEFMQ